MDVLQKVVGDAGDSYLVDIQFVAFDEEQLQIKGAFELRQTYGKTIIGHGMANIVNTY